MGQLVVRKEKFWWLGTWTKGQSLGKERRLKLLKRKCCEWDFIGPFYVNPPKYIGGEYNNVRY